MILDIDTLTRTIASRDLAARGNDLTDLAISLEEERVRFAPNPASGTRHLFSTIGNRHDCPPTGLSYFNTGLLQPGGIRAEDRDIKERFLRGKPLLCAELAHDASTDVIRLDVVVLRIALHVTATLDAANDVATYYLLEGTLPQTTLAGAVGRPLSAIVDLRLDEEPRIRHARTAPMEEARKVLGQPWTDCLAIECDMPGRTTHAFDVPDWMAMRGR